jgi:hypothetical protein
LITLLHRLGLEHQKLKIIQRNLDVKKLQAFIDEYEELLSSLPEKEGVIFIDAVYLTYATCPTGCWTTKDENLAIEQTSGRQRINIHGAINIESGQTRIVEAESVDAQSTIKLTSSIEVRYPHKQLICPQKLVQLNVSLRHSCLPSRKRPAELVWIAQTGAAA